MKGTVRAIHLSLSLLSVIALYGCEWVQYQFIERTQNPLSHELTQAAGMGDIAEVDRLIAAGAPLQEPYPLQAAVLHRQYDMARHLVERGSPVNGDGQLQAPLWFAAAQGDAQMAALLITLGADVNWQTDQLGTPLHAALYSSGGEADRLSIARLLVEHGADVDAIQVDEMFRKECLATPLHAAVFSAQEALVNLLIAHDADQSATDQSGRTPLQCARERLQSIKVQDLRASVENIVALLEAEEGRAR